LWNLDGGGSLVLWMRRASDEFFNFLASQWDASEGGNLDGWILSCHNVGGGGPAPASFIARNGGTVDILVGSTTVNDDTRHMLGVTLTATKECKLYVDGILDAQATLTVMPGVRTTSIMTFGADWEPINAPMWLGSVAMWDTTVLSPTDMSTLYTKGIA